MYATFLPASASASFRSSFCFLRMASALAPASLPRIGELLTIPVAADRIGTVEDACAAAFALARSSIALVIASQTAIALWKMAFKVLWVWLIGGSILLAIGVWACERSGT